MPAPVACPVADVDAVLSEYVNSRQDTLEMRRHIANLPAAGLQNSQSAPFPGHLLRECSLSLPTARPKSSDAARVLPAAAAAARSRYLRALEAKWLANARLRRLQNELDQLRREDCPGTSTENSTSLQDDDLRDYIALLHGSRRCSELQLVLKSLDSLLTSTPVNSHGGFAIRINDSVGTPPDRPAETLGQPSPPHSDQSRLFQLKKEVLEAKLSADRVCANRKACFDGLSDANHGRQQIHALSHAKDEIVTWLETELSKLSETSELLEDASPIKKSRYPALDTNDTLPSEKITGAYAQYVASRSEAIDVHNSLETMLNEYQSATLANPAVPHHPVRDSQDSKELSTRILRHLPFLVQILSSERSLLQQTVYLEARLAAASDALGGSLVKLREESHLLPSNASKHDAWGIAAIRAGDETRDFVREKLNESQQQFRTINSIVDTLSLQNKILAST
ncbi:hypothetical protein BU24DRAFT_230912 [Aaosphaeria arxii CBS 175.79]|uniref:Uncharacterized protein n=1 Tax=Aaosphaeria arxii CBS 175.79 TaxID=1450172 RepID=A0A6A5XK53_9PLEO|nr:uncharacterized protein BU24DRAFT_230912 [Aaosphaeria arxii CBS 175.79]KAF2013130.1 hypothetical protein BU24DRAFT_230912 [Aaosphaeria arxii CBS 175.79]